MLPAAPRARGYHFSQTAASELTVEPLLDEELFVILPAASPLVTRDELRRVVRQLVETGARQGVTLSPPQLAVVEAVTPALAA
ncbi:MAG: hypothetical protein Q8M01_01310 [Rubrivivax sp.]|nr:hypothetical protein [Rubrivivax sp.]